MICIEKGKWVKFQYNAKGNSLINFLLWCYLINRHNLRYFLLINLIYRHLWIPRLTVQYTGKAAHAASFPWKGVNALDAAVLAYQNVSCLRQQIKQSWRVHGIYSLLRMSKEICQIQNYSNMRNLFHKVIHINGYGK